MPRSAIRARCDGIGFDQHLFIRQVDRQEGTPTPAGPNAHHLNLTANIERLKLNVDRILPLHGRVVALSELYTTAGKTAPAR